MQGGQERDGEDHVSKVWTSHYRAVHVQIVVIRRNWRGRKSSTGLLMCSKCPTEMLDEREPRQPPDASTPASYGPEPTIGKVSQEEMLLLFRRISGIYQVDWSRVRPGDVTPGQIRVAQNSIAGTTADERGILRRLFDSAWRWCEASAMDKILRMLQLHLQLDLDDDGVPYIRVHSRLRIGNVETPWRFTWQTSLDGHRPPVRFRNIVDQQAYTYLTWTHSEKGCVGEYRQSCTLSQPPRE